jgi:hypothetical protein
MSMETVASVSAVYRVEDLFFKKSAVYGPHN